MPVACVDVGMDLAGRVPLGEHCDTWPPRLNEILGCPEHIVRKCRCGRELWWSVDHWEAF